MPQNLPADSASASFLNNPYYVYGGIALAVVVFILLVIVLRRALARRRPTVGQLAEKQEKIFAETIERAEKPEAVAAKTEAPAIEKPAPPKRDLRSLLAKTQEAFTSKLDALLLSTKQFDESFVDSLEELLYTSDLGPKTVEKLLTAVRERLSRGELGNFDSVKKALYEEILGILNAAGEHTKAFPNGHDSHAGAGVNAATSATDSNLQLVTLPKPWVILVVGVNGVGKTTSIGKLAQYYSKLGKKVLVVAGDTFRAAAEQQLSVWGERAHVDVYTSATTKDAAAVAFQGVEKGKADGADVVIVDTAGRLHTKENLMDELKKVKRVVGKVMEGAPHEVILVVDANTGQNARVQAQQFNEALGLTSLIVTKLDGTARGGVIISIAEEVGIGVQFIGTGEKIDDLTRFSSEEYAKGLLRL